MRRAFAGIIFIVFAGLTGAVLPALAQSGSYAPPPGHGGYYIPVAPQRSSGPPCGHYMTPPCAKHYEPLSSVDVPDGASADQLFAQGSRAFSARRYTTAAAYYQRAAALGHTRAQAALGLMYVNAKGVAEDKQKAAYWLTKAADNGHRVAQAQMGEYYEHGIAVPKDIAKAVHYYQLSAMQHWWLGEYSLAVDYELGIGVPHDRAMAITLFNRAASDGRDGMSQDLAAMLQRPGTPRFATVEQMGGYLNSLRGHPATGYAGGGNPLYPSPAQQYNMNRMGSPGNTCGGPYKGSGC